MEEFEVDIQRFLHNLDSNGKMIELSSYIDEIKVTANFARNHWAGGQVFLPLFNLSCKQNQLFWENRKLDCQSIYCLYLPQKVHLHQKDITFKTKMCVLSSAVLLHSTESPIISAEDLLNLEIIQMQWLREILDFTLRKRERNLETGK